MLFDGRHSGGYQAGKLHHQGHHGLAEGCGDVEDDETDDRSRHEVHADDNRDPSQLPVFHRPGKSSLDSIDNRLKQPGEQDTDYERQENAAQHPEEPEEDSGNRNEA